MTSFKINLTSGQALIVAVCGLFLPFAGWAIGPIAMMGAREALKKGDQSRGKAYAAIVLGIVDIAVPTVGYLYIVLLQTSLLESCFNYYCRPIIPD